MFEHLWQQFFTAARHALGRIVRVWLLGVLIGALAMEGAALALGGGWPPRTFAHVAAVVLALVLGYAFAATTALIEGVRGLAAAAGQIDDVARAGADAGINVLDAVVDAVDGPNRHGIR